MYFNGVVAYSVSCVSVSCCEEEEFSWVPRTFCFFPFMSAHGSREGNILRRQWLARNSATALSSGSWLGGGDIRHVARPDWLAAAWPPLPLFFFFYLFGVKGGLGLGPYLGCINLLVLFTRDLDPLLCVSPVVLSCALFSH
jgi:hypothetical protein